MRRKTKSKSSLTSATSLNEAIKILQDRNAAPIYGQHVKLAFNLKNDTDNKRRLQMLSETEMHLQEEEKKKLDEMVHTEESAEGNNRVKGETGQSDGRELDDIQDDPTNDSHNGSEPAQQQTGESQLDTALTSVMNETHDIDPMNQAIIDYMGDGMSQVEAHNAASKDKQFSEAIFTAYGKQKFIPMFRAISKELKSLRETIVTLDKKLEESKKQPAGLSETVMTSPQWPQSGPETKVTTTLPKYTSNVEEIEDKRDTILKKYCSDE